VQVAAEGFRLLRGGGDRVPLACGAGSSGGGAVGFALNTGMHVERRSPRSMRETICRGC